VSIEIVEKIGLMFLEDGPPGIVECYKPLLRI